jgi:hypothetical protein
LLKEESGSFLMLVGVPQKVWNPVFLTGTIAFAISMMFRGFLDATFAVFPLALSTLVLFAGVWRLSANGMVVFDKTDSACYCIYKHMGYLQKSYNYPLTSIEQVLITSGAGKNFNLLLLKDDGQVIQIATSKSKESLALVADRISHFLDVPVAE